MTKKNRDKDNELRKRVAEIEKLLSSSDEAKRAEAKRLYEEFRKSQGGAYVPEISVPTCPDGQHYDTDLEKCVPDDGGPGPEPEPEPEPPTPGGTEGPYPSTGKELGATTRRATRHYASGKPDDETVERNTKNIPYQNYQSIHYVKMTEIEHDDNISIKLGGTHMGSGWFDHGISFEQGQTCLGYEPDHPTTHGCVIKGPKLGSILNKRIGISGVYRKQTNHTELWIDMGDGNGWKKAIESDDVDGFNPNNDENDEVQLRIDGFTKSSEPEIDVAKVQEIAA